MRSAQQLRSQGDLREAKSQLLKANDLVPGNAEVMSLLGAVQAELGEPVGNAKTWAEMQIELRKIGEDRARQEVRGNMQKAAELAGNKDYAGALEELRIAALAVELKNDMDWEGLDKQVAAQRAETETAYDAQQRQSQAAQNAVAAERQRQEYIANEARKRQYVDSLIAESQKAFSMQQYQRAQDFAQRALSVEPNNSLAYEMHNISVKAGRDSSTEAYHRTRQIEINKLMEAAADLKVPQTNILEMDVATWDKAQNRVASRRSTAVTDPQDLAVWEQVRTTQVGRLAYTEETGDYNEVVKNLNLLTGVQILTTPEARAIITEENLKLVIELVNSITLKDLLQHMTGKSAKLAWTVKNGVVIIGDKSQAAGTIVTEVYPVKDLIFKQTQFLPPKILTIPGEAADDTPRTGSEDEAVAGIELADLVTSLKDATDPKYWETDGVEIRPEDSGLLSVKASPEMQARVNSVLTDMRRFQTPIVTVDSKFLTISRNFL
ncbi:MAG: hypothetical protein JNK15_19185, partial [Planctomycetes bacterium]|nr:hypothetical protein [Planctomycetota bacterium]